MEDVALFDSPVAMGHGRPSAQMMNMLGERGEWFRRFSFSLLGSGLYLLPRRLQTLILPSLSSLQPHP